jgi:hypothetical protein
MALNIKNSGWFYAGNPAMPIDVDYYTLRTPVYPLFLALIYIISLNNWIVLVIQNLISIYNIYLLRNIIRQLQFTRRYDWLLSAFILLYPSQFINANTIAPDLLLQTAVIHYFRSFVLFIKNKDIKWVWWMSFSLMVGMLIKPVFYPFAICHLVIVLLFLKRYVQKASLLIGFAILPLGFAFSYMYWNSLRTEKIHFSSTQSFNAVYYYYFFYSSTKGQDYAQKFLKDERRKIASMPTFAQRYDYANARGKELLCQNFIPYVLYHVKHSFRLFIDPGKGELDMFTGQLTLGKLYKPQRSGFYAVMKNEGWIGIKKYIYKNVSFPIAIIVFVINCLRIAGIVLLALSDKFDYRIRLFALFLFMYFSLTTGPIANPRYFMPISIIASGCAVLGFQSILLQTKRKYNLKA